MALFITLLAFVVLAALISYFGYRFYLRPGRVYDRLSETKTSEASVLNSSDPRESGPLVRIIQLIGEKVPISPADAGLTRRYLMAAGFRAENALAIFYGLRLLSLALFLILGLLLRDHVTAIPVLRWAVMFASGALGWFGPGLLLDRMVSARQERIRLSTADALDLMVVCIEAGHALDQSFVRVSQELRITHKDIADEFSLVNLEIRAGKRRSEALHNLAQRTGERELQKLVAIMVQSDRFGTSIADSLRVHAESMRIRRRQEAEERAGKIGVKLVFPIFFFILPCMFLVTAGPGVLHIVKYLLPALKQASQH